MATPNRKIVPPVRLVQDNEHPEYAYWIKEYEKIRDCLIGEVEIKKKGTEYLPMTSGQTSEEYLEYLERATFFNMCGRTLNGLVGTIFRRNPKILGINQETEEVFDIITKDKLSITLFSKQIAAEILSVGRVGVLLDKDTTGEFPAYFAGYLAENILDWEVGQVRGRDELVKIVLREVIESGEKSSSEDTRFTSSHRVLRLVPDGGGDFEYFQEVYLPGTNLKGEPDFTSTPTILGKPFNFIPFKIFGSLTNSPGVEKPPLIDIVRLNLSHYRSYAQLEHGRFYTALPVYYAFSDGSDEGADYSVGPNRVWEVKEGQAPGIVEYEGAGLKFLESSLDIKEQQISSLGGRMLGSRTTAVAESDNTVKLKEKNEQSLLLNATSTMNEGLSELLNWFVEWEEIPTTGKVQIRMNQDFLFNSITARDYRAFTMMYKDNILPIDVLYDVMIKTEIIDDNISIEKFKDLLDDPTQFPNQPDIHAKMEGFPDADTKLAGSKNAPKN